MTRTRSTIALGLCLFAALSTSCTTDITDTLSSTTPGVWYGENGTIRSEYRAIAFTTWNFENVKRDLARGEGEYLASLAALLEIEPARQRPFFAFAQRQAAPLLAGGATTPAELLAALETGWRQEREADDRSERS